MRAFVDRVPDSGVVLRELGEQNRENMKKISDSHSGPFIAFLVATALVCGALVMVLEILGSRVIGPFFGVSLFVWTSLITVTLVALAAGYAVGGIVADRRQSPDNLYGIILAAGVLVLMIPVVKAPVLKACLPLGLRGGTLVSALFLFGPALFLLGCVSPYLVKIAAREMSSIGRTVGILYAVSTGGSFLGTILTGFVLIAYFSVSSIFKVVGGGLILLAVLYFVLFRKKYVVLTALLLPLVPLSSNVHQELLRASGTKVKVVSSRDTFYGNLKVVDYSGGLYHTRELAIDGLIQGGIDLSSGLSIYAYPYYLQFVPYLLNPGGERCLAIGLGAGIVPRWYEMMGVEVDVVDIDPAVVETAREYFGFKLSGDVSISDARYFLTNSSRTYDYLLLDVFTGDTTPGHVMSLEAFRLMKERMSPRGIFAANIIGSLRGRTYMTASVVRTLADVFRTVEIYPTFRPEDGKETGNIVVVAYDDDPIPLDSERAQLFPVHPFAEESVRKVFGTLFRFPAGTPSIVLTDDYNPIDFYDLWVKEFVRKDIFRDTDLDVLL
jgi:spermidine synthase